MLLKVGDLARRCGLTVRTLHHYDAIGLLAPSARSEAGYRLYDRDDIARLHQIQALRRFGLSLADIGAVLARPDSSLASIVQQQISMLDTQIEQAMDLRSRLSRLQDQLRRGDEPELAEWLTTLERMTMYDKYFSQDELARLPLYQGGKTAETEWRGLVDEVRALMERGLTPQSDEAQSLSKRWMAMVERDTDRDPRLLAKLNAMHLNEPSVQAQTGITPELMTFVLQANAESKLRIYAKYLSPEEFAFMREHYGQHTYEWPELIGALRDHMEQGSAPDAPEVQQLALRWLSFFRSYAGDNPETHAKIRLAHEKEPELMAGSLIDATLLGFVKDAMAHLKPR